MQIKQVYFVLSKQEETYFLALPGILFQKVKTSRVRMPKIGNV